MSDNLHYLSATDALAKFASGELSPVTLMQAIINRAHAVEPTTSVASVAADWDPSQPIHIKGKAVHGPFAPVLTPYFNALGRMLVMNVPTGRDQNNVPTGMQIVGPAFRDEVPFRVAMAYESRFRFFDGNAFPRL